MQLKFLLVKRLFLLDNFDMNGVEQGILFLIVVVLIIAALTVKALRKTIGLLLVILGGLACLTIIGLIVGIPMIVIGGLFLFI